MVFYIWCYYLTNLTTPPLAACFLVLRQFLLAHSSLFCTFSNFSALLCSDCTPLGVISGRWKVTTKASNAKFTLQCMVLAWSFHCILKLHCFECHLR